jgi:Lipase (class 3)
MKIQVGTSPGAFGRKPFAAPSADAGRSTPPVSDLNLSRQLHFDKSSEVDEAAVILVELSVLIYSPLSEIRKTFARLNSNLSPAAFDAGLDRKADGDWLELHQKFLDSAAWMRNLTLRPQVQPSTPHPLPVWLQTPSPPVFLRPRADKDPARPPTPGELLFKGAGVPLPEPPPAVLEEALPPPSPDPSTSERKHTEATSEELERRNAPPRVLAVLLGKTALVVFRGTASFSDWGRNLSCWPALRWPLRHWGFDTTWQGVRPQLEAWLTEATRTLGEPPTLYLGGHSLGGALATLAATDLAGRYPIARVVTVGSPRVGGWLFRRAYCRSPAASALDGKPRSLPAVTTRWVHGSDIVTLLPPPLVTAHVVSAESLHAADRLPIEEFFPAGLMDPAPLLGLITRDPQLGASSAPMSSPHTAWHGQARQVIGQSMFWLAMAVPSLGWTRIFLPLLPAALEQTLRSSFHHKSMRYLGFMPATALFRAMFPSHSIEGVQGRSSVQSLLREAQQSAAPRPDQ